MTELVQLIGYRDMPLDEIAPRFAALDQQYGQEVMDAAKEELLEIVTTTRTLARLKVEVRQIARQILGVPPNETSSPPSVSPPSSPGAPEAHSDRFQPHPSPDEMLEMEPSPAEDERYMAAYEAHEGTLYCCDRPRLKWFGEIGDLSVACETCGYVLFARDELMPDGEPPGILIDLPSSHGF